MKSKVSSIQLFILGISKKKKFLNREPGVFNTKFTVFFVFNSALLRLLSLSKHLSSLLRLLSLSKHLSSLFSLPTYCTGNFVDCQETICQRPFSKTYTSVKINLLAGCSTPSFKLITCTIPLLMPILP